MFDSIKEACPSTGVVLQRVLHLKTLITIDDYAKDGGEELLTKMHCVLFTNP